MNNKQSLHIHTTYADGKNKPEELVIRAIERGFGSIGFSEHSYLAYPVSSHQMTVADTENYKREIAQLKSKYKGKIDIFCGMEYDIYSDLSTDGFDYLIGSVHLLDCGGDISDFDLGPEATHEYIDKHFDGDGLAFVKRYYETVATFPSVKSVDILGHFDIVVKNNEKLGFVDTASKEYLDLGYAAIHSLRGKIPFFEVNTGAIARGYRSIPYPQMEFLKEFRRLGFGAVLNSDCHNKDFIDCYYDEATQLLIEAGYKTKWILTTDGFKEVAL